MYIAQAHLLLPRTLLCMGFHGATTLSLHKSAHLVLGNLGDYSHQKHNIGLPAEMLRGSVRSALLTQLSLVCPPGIALLRLNTHS